jgi:2-oxoisovalerate dehydrogenase E2 component (dihydrolipoyl transacylase)
MGVGRMSEFTLPDVGEGLTEAEILTWRVAVGDTVAVNDVLVEIETAKSVVELPSPFAGVVTGLLVDEGTTVPVGTPIIAISEADEPAEREPTLVGYGARRSGPRRRRKVPADLGTVVQLHGGHERDVHRRVRVKPPVRKLAKDLGIDVADVPASGPTVTRADVEAYAAARPGQISASTSGAALAPDAVPASGEVRVPVRGVRKAMADAMVQSVRAAPHATEWLTVDVSRTVELVARLHREPAFDGVKVTPTVIVAKAVCLAMRHTPSLNAAWIDAAGDQSAEVLLHGSINLGVAVATDRGLVVPNVKSAEQLSMVELAREIERLTDVARDGRTQPADQSGGTFTVTNVGVFGVDAGTPILNVGESGILAVGAIQRRPWVSDDDTVVPRWVTTLAVSFDHRIVDGAEAARFLTDVADILRDPATALTY